MYIKLNKETCTGCSFCIKSCPFGAIQMNESLPEFNDQCVYCGACERACPTNSILLQRPSPKKDDFDDYQNFWVVLEIDKNLNKIRKVSLELLSEARRLADQVGQKVVALALYDKQPEHFRENLAKVGCDEVIQVKNDNFVRYDTDIYTDVIVGIISKYKPAVVLYPATEIGRDLAPRISARLKTGLTADCTSLDIDETGNLVQIRPTFGGNIMASIICPHNRPQMATVRPNVFSVVECNKANDLFIRDINIKIEGNIQRVKFKEFIELIDSFKDVSEAEVIISGGYGMKSAENFKLLQKLAEKMGAAVGASRKAVDEGWVPFKIQIGQTGKTVAPDLYIACGISGALQHTIGIKNAKKIIAINSDPTAPIFSMADVGIIGDAVEIMKELYNLLEKTKKNPQLKT